MNEPDDRLDGDLVWELFPQEDPDPAFGRARRVTFWLVIAVVVGVSSWFQLPSLAIEVACLSVAVKDVQKGRRLARAIPDKAGGGVCALFSYSWAAFKVGVVAFAILFVLFEIGVGMGWEEHGPPPGFAAAMFLWTVGFLTSSILSAAALVKAIRSGMRVWIGEGVNQARTLFLGMLIVGFFFLVFVPMLVWMAFGARRGGAGSSISSAILFMSTFLFTFMIAGPVVILAVLDWISRRVLADQPGKFGPMVPTVGKMKPRG